MNNKLEKVLKIVSVCYYIGLIAIIIDILLAVIFAICPNNWFLIVVKIILNAFALITVAIRYGVNIAINENIKFAKDFITIALIFFNLIFWVVFLI